MRVRQLGAAQATARGAGLRGVPPVRLHEVVRLLVDYVVTVSAEYLDPVKDALYCEAAAAPARRSVQTALHEMVRTLATWMAT